MHTVYALVVLYALCYQLQAPLEPYLVETLVRDDQDASAAYARLQSFFSLVQLVGSCARCLTSAGRGVLHSPRRQYQWQ